jgi:uncharacterized protein (DUF58 family)
VTTPIPAVPAVPGVFRRLDLKVQRRLDGLLAGEHRGIRLGPGSDAEELARYQAGDDVRRIDWNVTARSIEPQVWRTRADHALDTWLLLDETASMAFGTAASSGLEKAEIADQLAAAVGLLTDGPGNRLGVVRYGRGDGGGLVWSRPVAGRVAARRALRPATAGQGGQAGQARPRQGAPAIGLGEAVDALGRRHRRPGVRVVVSDLVDPSGQVERPFDWEAALRRLAARHDVVVLEVLDPRELELPDVGHLVLVDPETGRRRDVHTGEARLRARYAAAAAAQRAAIAAAVRACGAAHVRLRTDRDWFTDLARAVRSRRTTHPVAHQVAARRRRRVR